MHDPAQQRDYSGSDIAQVVKLRRRAHASDDGWAKDARYPRVQALRLAGEYETNGLGTLRRGRYRNFACMDIAA